MPAAEFQYLLLRVVPSLERGERINAGVVVYCPARDFLAARIALDESRLAALPGALDAAAVRASLEAIAAVVAGTGAQGGDGPPGPLSRMPAQQRFGWLASPSSTAIQPSPIHTGLTSDPSATLDRLFESLVR